MSAAALTTTELLDWSELGERLAAEARSERGAAACRSLPLAADAGEATAGMAEVAEMAALLAAGVEPPSLAFPEIEAHLETVERGLPLGAEELRRIAAVCEIAGAVRRFFALLRTDAGAPPAPLLSAVAAQLGSREAIAHRARETFDAAGEIRDAVSPELARLRRERESLSQHARAEMDRLMRSDVFASYLQDQFVTLRADRFVLPLRASFKSMGLGIVHDTSRTGETVFLEPTEVVEINNRLKVAELDIRRESRRILEELAALIAAEAGGLRGDLDILARLDVVAAKARLGRAYGGVAARVVEEPIMDLRRLRHPLLALRAEAEGFEVVPNDVPLGGDVSPASVLVVSGPNAGGKTVLLKSVGLAALLVRAGMLVPVEPGSRVGFFDDVLADIGDRQSVLGDLSTFSGHLANIGAILRAASARDRRCLVLLDEVMAGTNPEQGAALARATLEALAGVRGLVVATTHYDSLKALAESDARFRNAGMEYDIEHLAPTFRLRDGVPGRSYAFDIAGRMGMPPSLVARARELAGAGTLGLEDVVRDLEAREQELARRSAELEEARAELAASAGDQRTAAEALVRRERELAKNARQAVDEAVREARDGIRAIVRKAQEAGSAPAADQARRALDEAAHAAVSKLPEPPPLDVDRLKAALAGRSLGVKAQPAPAAAPRKPPPRGGAAEVAPPVDDGEVSGLPSAANTLDLRGFRADDGIDAVVAFLDRAALESRSPVFIIHGHGTGALKKAVREYLATSPYVRRWRPGGRQQGGDGVSAVEL